MRNQLKVARAPRLCKQSAEGSLIVLIRRLSCSERTDCFSHMVLPKWPNYFNSSLNCLTLGSMLSAFNETLALQRSTTKWCRQMAEASQHCHRPCLLLWCSRTLLVALGPSLIPQGRPSEWQWGQRGMAPRTDRCTDPFLFGTVFQGRHLVVTVCLMSPWLAPCCSSTRGFQTMQPSPHFNGSTSPLEFPRGRALVLLKSNRHLL